MGKHHFCWPKARGLFNLLDADDSGSISVQVSMGNGFDVGQLCWGM